MNDASRNHPSPDGERPPRPLAISDVLGRLIAQRGWRERLHDSQVHGRWTEIVGHDLAAHVEPIRLRGGVLVVRAESGAWASQLRYLSPWLVQRAQEVLGADRVDRVQILTGPQRGSSSSLQDG